MYNVHIRYLITHDAQYGQKCVDGQVSECPKKLFTINLKTQLGTLVHYDKDLFYLFIITFK